MQLLLNFRNESLQLQAGHCSFFRSSIEAAQQLLAIEQLACAVVLDNHELRAFQTFVRGKAIPTGSAFAAAPNGLGICCIARFYYFRIGVLALRTLHGS